MPARVTNRPAATSTRRPEEKRLPAIDVGSTLSRKIDKAIISPESKPERQLKFTQRAGFVSPSGNRLQVVYLTPAASKTGLDITYVDSKAKQFWAQAPGVSGLARGPFKLPAGVDKALATVTAKELKAEAREAKQPKRPVSPGLVFQNSGSDNAAIRRRLNGGSGSYFGGGGGSGGYFGGGGGGGSGGYGGGGGGGGS